MYDLVLFDLDGTLINTSKGIILAIEETVDAFGLDKLTNDEKLNMIGPPIEFSLKTRYGIDEYAILEIVDYFRSIYKNKYLNQAEVYNGIYELLGELSQTRKLMVATYKRDDYAKQIIEYFNLDKYFYSVVGSKVNVLNTKADIINFCLNIKHKKSIMIGDSIHDAKGAMECGIDFIGVTYGFGFKNKDEIINCNGICAVDSPIEIIKYFKRCI